MNKSLRKAIVAGNWKMNNDRKAAKALITELAPMVKDAGCEVVLCVPFTNLETALSLCEGTNLHVGAQNCHWAASGAFTGEISAQMLAEMGVEYVIIGHSERRQYFGETDKTVNLRTVAAVRAGLKAIVCVGELKDEREAGYTDMIVTYQTQMALHGLSAKELENVVVAYEREAFTFAPGNVRITIDAHLRSSPHPASFFEPGRLLSPYAPGTVIVEVKYDAFIPDIVRDAVCVPGAVRVAHSKYALARRYE
mgnify:CR=1 FL=1